MCGNLGCKPPATSPRQVEIDEIEHQDTEDHQQRSEEHLAVFLQEEREGLHVEPGIHDRRCECQYTRDQ